MRWEHFHGYASFMTTFWLSSADEALLGCSPAARPLIQKDGLRAQQDKDRGKLYEVVCGHDIPVIPDLFITPFLLRLGDNSLLDCPPSGPSSRKEDELRAQQDKESGQGEVTSSHGRSLLLGHTEAPSGQGSVFEQLCLLDHWLMRRSRTSRAARFDVVGGLNRPLLLACTWKCL